MKAGRGSINEVFIPDSFRISAISESVTSLNVSNGAKLKVLEGKV